MTESGEPGDAAAPSEAPASLTGRFLAFALELRRARRERALARRTSRESLRVYRELEALRPELTGIPRYRELVVRQTGLDEVGARRVVERAESNFAMWPIERPVCLRDIVQYLVVEKWLALDPGAQGFRSPLTEIVAAEIPDGL